MAVEVKHFFVLTFKHCIQILKKMNLHQLIQNI